MKPRDEEDDRRAREWVREARRRIEAGEVKNDNAWLEQELARVRSSLIADGIPLDWRPRPWERKKGHS